METMISFLPRVVPSATVPIPNYHADYEQRSMYPYIYTATVLMDERVKQERTYTKDASVQSRELRPTKSASASASAPTPTVAPAEPTLIRLMVNALDPLTAMYSAEWMKDIDSEFKDAIRSFLADEENSQVLGKTRCRDCLYYFEKPFVLPSKTRVKSIGSFLSFWWGTPVSINGVVYRWKKLTGTPIELHHLDNGHWKK